MTKKVRIENADTSPYKVLVQVWDKGGQAENGTPLPDTLVREVALDHPTAMTDDGIYITSTRYLIVTEKTG